MRRMWIVGNGPSLKHTPLHLLKGEACFAMNGIWMIYDKTDWRPTHYWMVDFNPRVPREIWERGIREHQKLGIPMWLFDGFHNGYPENHPNHGDLPSGVGDIPNTTWVPRCEKHHPYRGGNSKGMQKWHLPEICTGYNGISGVIQVATTLGYGPLYLVGCDLGYQSDSRLNHFDPDYNNTDKRDLSEQLQRDAEWAHKIAARCSPVPIYNATLGGHLEVHPRVDFYEVLKCLN